MLVRERMSHPVISTTPDTPVQDALVQMREAKVSRFPVVDKKGKLVGIVGEDDLLNASPSQATSLSVWEVNYLLSKITVERVMSKDVITVDEDTPLEEAARIMADHRIGGLPVMKKGELVGMITQTNIFEILLELLGARQPGLRLTALVKEEKGKLHQITKAIDEAGGNIIALSTFGGQGMTDRELMVKVDQIEESALRDAVESLVVAISDVRVMFV